MGRTAGILRRARSILREFDPRAVPAAASSQEGCLRRLLCVDWSAHFARDVLTARLSGRPPGVQKLGSQRPDTVSVPELVRAFEPDLLAAVQQLLVMDWPAATACASRLPTSSTLQHGPLHCCALFGLGSVADALLEAGADPLAPGEHGLLAHECARACGWLSLAERLERAALAGQAARVDAAAAAGTDDDCEPLPGGQPTRGPLCPLAGTPPADSRAWRELSLPRVDSPFSSQLAEEVDASEMATADFEAAFFRTHRPLLLRGALGQAAGAWAASPSELLAGLGSRLSCGEGPRGAGSGAGRLSSLPYPEDFAPKELLPELSFPGRGAEDVLQGHRGYFFAEAGEGSALAELLDEGLRLPEALPFAFQGRSPRVSRQLALGQSGTGSPWHWHQDAFNCCVAGERAWLLRPPAEALMSRRPVGEGVPGADGALFALQRPGDVLYVPELWGHCVVNRSLSAAVALEFGSL